MNASCTLSAVLMWSRRWAQTHIKDHPKQESMNLKLMQDTFIALTSLPFHYAVFLRQIIDISQSGIAVGKRGMEVNLGGK